MKTPLNVITHISVMGNHWTIIFYHIVIRPISNMVFRTLHILQIRHQSWPKFWLPTLVLYQTDKNSYKIEWHFHSPLFPPPPPHKISHGYNGTNNCSNGILMGWFQSTNFDLCNIEGQLMGFGELFFIGFLVYFFYVPCPLQQWISQHWFR